MKAVEVAVREAGGLGADELGVNLMRKAFHIDNGPLTDMNAERGERQARSDFFAGAIGSYKNSHSHPMSIWTIRTKPMSWSCWLTTCSELSTNAGWPSVPDDAT